MDITYIMKQMDFERRNKCRYCRYQTCIDDLYIDSDGISITDYGSAMLRQILVDYRYMRLYKIKCEDFKTISFIKNFIIYNKKDKTYEVDQIKVAQYISEYIGYEAEGDFYYYPTNDCDIF